MISTAYKEKIIKIGDSVRVKNTIVEEKRTRVQTFEGIVIALNGRGENRMITVRRIGDRGVGVERMWPLNSPAIVDIEVVKNAKKVRRAKLYYMRNLTGKAAKTV